MGEKMKGCELCSNPARMYCESDKASLCWDCDERVHGANFLVARHSRCLLCHVCQSQTPWKASGLKLGHTVSVCDNCVVTNRNGREHEMCAEEEEQEIHARNDEEEDDEDEDEGEDEDDDVDENEGYSGGEDDEDGENQVVPWSCTPPPPVTSSSCSEGESRSRLGGGAAVSVLKRTREDPDLDSDEDIGCCSSQRNYSTISTTLTLRAPGDEEATSLTSFRPLKQPRKTEVGHSATIEDHVETKSNSMAIISSLKRFQQNTVSGDNVSATILEICKLSRDPRVVDLDLH